MKYLENNNVIQNFIGHFVLINHVNTSIFLRNCIIFQYLHQIFQFKANSSMFSLNFPMSLTLMQVDFPWRCWGQRMVKNTFFDKKRCCFDFSGDKKQAGVFFAPNKTFPKIFAITCYHFRPKQCTQKKISVVFCHFFLRKTVKLQFC